LTFVICHLRFATRTLLFKMVNDKCQMMYDQCFPSSYLMFRVGDGACAGAAAGDGLAAVAGSAPLPELTCSDLINANNCTNWSSLT
jgi:hypothetical protein